MSKPVSFARQAQRTHHVAVASMLSAVAFVLMYVEFPIPALIPSFIKLDVSDLPELLAAYALGPIWGVVVTLLKNLLFSVFHGTSSAYVGELCNFLLGSVFSFTAGLFYHRHKSRRTALFGAVLGAVLMALISLPINYFIVYPAYVVVYKLPMDVIISMYQAILPTADNLIKCLAIFNIPFTFFKGMLDVLLCFLIYKPLSPLLHK
ncbi:MAG: ECF transporter S component [Oscillospiraceae bacterium]|jgi:riboflavin transporter FmnP|nr:ECF transporter S component [Oscillospiraceae bacterium]MBQ1804551.1 ECF transporter S component [Oscillospiraceae bacterium]MBQ1834582.1 ECF transporter S component [Oscillospiraceae bacterium]MBQ2324483.1 ECF transporter S component [Oscillospiraceae bacterium]MBQ5535954.1 ECF transporter S component [Oscillospiraceae bacterium]